MIIYNMVVYERTFSVYVQDIIKKPRNSKFSHAISLDNSAVMVPKYVTLTPKTETTGGRRSSKSSLPKSISSPQLATAWSSRHLENAIPPLQVFVNPGE